MSSLEIHQFLCRSDNYGVLIHDNAKQVTASIDAPDAQAVAANLTEKGWQLSHILTTHHHADHVGGNAQLKADSGCLIIGPRDEADRIDTLDKTVAGGDRFTFGSFEVEVLDTPGHTSGHISFYVPGAGVAFVGDTMFAMGCGRLFEGDARTMWASLSRLMALPDDTTIYCGHEYTLANARFAAALDPTNEALQQRLAEVVAMRERGALTLPTTIVLEKATSPFVRAHDPALREHLNMAEAEDWEVFAEVRKRKDNA
ncbi:MAG: hydroxyacylglutathione hydrolase [Pseudomonadota bacterium]